MRKGRKILLAYINEAAYNSDENLCMDIDTARIFDVIKLSTYKDIQNCDTPPCNHSPNPMAILDVMNSMGDDDILLYSETSIPYHRELKKWFKIASKNSAIFLFHGDAMNGMTKVLMSDFYYKTKLLPFYNLDGSLFLLRKNSQYLIEEWRDHIISHKINCEQPVNEISILSNVIYSHLDDSKIILLFEE